MRILFGSLCGTLAGLLITALIIFFTQGIRLYDTLHTPEYCEPLFYKGKIGGETCYFKPDETIVQLRKLIPGHTPYITLQRSSVYPDVCYQIAISQNRTDKDARRECYGN